MPRPANLGGYSRYNRTTSSRIRRYTDTASNGRKKSTPKPPSKSKYGGGMPTSVQNILTKREEAKKVAATKPAPKPTPKQPVTSTPKAPAVSTTPVAAKPQTSTNQIYKKPTSTVAKPKQNKTVGKKLENIDLPKEIDKTVGSKKKENLPVETKVKENKNNRPTNKIVLSENEPIYLTTREGKRIRIDHGHYKKEKPKTYQSLTVRKLLSSVEERLQKNDKGIVASDYIKKGKSLSFRKVNSNKESSVLGVNRTDTLVKTLLENSFTAGVARLSGFNEGIILNYNKENNPIQINSPYDYENFLIEKVAANKEDTYSKKMLSYVQSKLNEDNSSNQIIPEYKSIEEGKNIAMNRASRLENIELKDTEKEHKNINLDISAESTSEVTGKNDPNKISPYSEKLINFVKDYETLRLESYNGGQTIGYGHDYKPGEVKYNTITEQQALEYLKSDLNEAYDRVVSKETQLVEVGYPIDISTFSQGEIDALVDFSFSRGQGLAERDSETGLSSLAGAIVAISENDNEKLKEILMREVYNTKSVYYEGLELRRMDEYDIYSNQEYTREYDLERILP